jgi:hypothetical protein
MKLNRFLSITAVAAVLLSFSSSLPSQAALILHVDASNKEVYLTGSDTGTATETAAGDFRFAWRNGDGGGGGTLGLGATVLQVSASTLVRYRLGVSTGGSGGLEVYFSLADDPGTFTATGTGARISYAIFDAATQATLESYAGPLPSSETFAPLEIEHIAVPEPSQWAMMGVVAVGIAGAGWRRWRAGRS